MFCLAEVLDINGQNLDVSFGRNNIPRAMSHSVCCTVLLLASYVMELPSERAKSRFTWPCVEVCSLGPRTSLSVNVRDSLREKWGEEGWRESERESGSQSQPESISKREMRKGEREMRERERDMRKSLGEAEGRRERDGGRERRREGGREGGRETE